MIFEVFDGFLLPRLDLEHDGKQRVANGDKLLTPQQAAEKFSARPEAIERLHQAFIDDISPSRIEQTPVKPLTAEDELRILRYVKYAHIPDPLFDQLRLECSRRSLSMWGNHIVAETKWNDRTRRTELSIFVRLDGMRACAFASGEMAGRLGPEWASEDGSWKDCWIDKKFPAMARVGILRRGIEKPFWGVAHFRSAAQWVMKNGKSCLDDFWEKMPELMLAKVSESLAIRAAFPERFDGIYSVEEMGQASNPRGGRIEIDRSTGEVISESHAPAASREPVMPGELRYELDEAYVVGTAG